MQRLRRVTGVVIHLLLLHLLAVGSGDACVLPAVVGAAHAALQGDAAARHAGGADMAGMRMNGHAMSGDAAPCDRPADDGTAPRPTSGCQSMAPCAPAALAAAPLAVDRAATLVDADVAGLVVLPPASRATAPEPPPPRA